MQLGLLLWVLLGASVTSVTAGRLLLCLCACKVADIGGIGVWPDACALLFYLVLSPPALLAHPSACINEGQ